MKPFFKNAHATLYCGDALAVLPALAAGGVDAVVTDPPYGQSNEAYDRGVDPAVWRECFRACQPNAALLALAGNPTYHRLASGIEAAGWRVRQMWAWVYTDGLITSAWPKEGFDRLAPAMTPICYATTGKVLLPLEREGEPWEVRFARTDKCAFSERTNNASVQSARGHWPRSVVCTEGVEGFQYFRLSNNASNKRGTGHPNQKPLPLMEWLVGKLPGALVLDPFAGSCTTAVACIQTGRRFVGCELSEDYCKIGVGRIKRACAELRVA